MAERSHTMAILWQFRYMVEIETMVHYMLQWCLAEMAFIVNAIIRSLFPSGMQ